MEVSRWCGFESSCILLITFESCVLLVYQNLDPAGDKNSFKSDRLALRLDYVFIEFMICNVDIYIYMMFIIHG